MVAERSERGTLHEVVAEAMQLAWDDFVTDTGCFPDCFTPGANRTLYADFARGNFARLVAMWLEPKVETCGCGHHVDEHCDNSRFAEVGSIIGPCLECACTSFVTSLSGSSKQP